eukprot:m.43963 g.43963  ORF g.43963 m.43963 type:complete len:425 (-) comp10027_c0_seq1:1941-3215(-)
MSDDDANEPLLTDSPQRPVKPEATQAKPRSQQPGRTQRGVNPDLQRAQEELQRQREQEEKLRELKYGAESILSLVCPVSLCMIVVVATIQSVAFFSQHDTTLPYTPMRESDDQTTGERLSGALINVMIVIAVVIVMTMLLVTLYKYRCYKAIHIWLVGVTVLLLFVMTWLYIDQLLDSHNLGIDYFTLFMIIWNIGVAGLFAIHWKGPLRLQQIYHIFISSLMALILIKNLADWTCWMLLGGIAVYDLFAVLCPGGPLKQLLETAQERDEQLFPALIYSSAMVWITMADVDTTNKDVSNFAPQPASERTTSGGTPANVHVDDSPPENLDEEEEEAGGVKLGLGDFIFYSVLVGKAATSNEWTTIVACYIGIIVGLVATLFILSVYQKALPALPISVAFGIFFYFTTSQLITPCLVGLAKHAAFL